MNTKNNFPFIALFLIAISGIVAISSNLGEALESISWLFFSNHQLTNFEELRNGEVWRLFTPIFIHFGIQHILFNSIALYDFGNIFETNRKVAFVILFVLIASAASNTLQYVADGPLFGGLSGLVYGMFGYCLVIGNSSKKSEFKLSNSEIITMLGWYILCWTGLLGPVANWGHTGGLITGLIWGAIDSRNNHTSNRRINGSLRFGVRSKLFFGVISLTFLLAVLGLLRFKHDQDSSRNFFELTVRGEVVSYFDSQTVKKELENLTNNCSENCFLILAISADTYLQTYYTRDQNQFDLEYRDDDASRHFKETSGKLTLHEVQNIFNNYYNKTNNWNAGINWQPLE